MLVSVVSLNKKGTAQNLIKSQVQSSDNYTATSSDGIAN